MKNSVNAIWLFCIFPHKVFYFVEMLAEHAQDCAMLFKNNLISTSFYNSVIILQPFYMPKSLADQFNSPHTSLYFTARLLLYCLVTSVAEGDKKSWSLSFPHNQTNSSVWDGTVPAVTHGFTSFFFFTMRMWPSLGLLDILSRRVIKVMIMWSLLLLLVLSVHSRYVASYVSLHVTEYLIAAVMYPHYAPIALPSHPDCFCSLGVQRGLGFRFYPLPKLLHSHYQYIGSNTPAS